MSDNPFSGFNVEMPKKYADQIKRFCVTGGSATSGDITPFERQVDFWFCAFVLAVKKELPPVEEHETYNVTAASILSTDPYRVTHIQAVYLSFTKDVTGLSDNRKVFDFAINLANAGIPLLIQTLDDNDQKPLWNILDEIEAMMS